jgi:hypothetical protein
MKNATEFFQALQLNCFIQKVDSGLYRYFLVFGHNYFFLKMTRFLKTTCWIHSTFLQKFLKDEFQDYSNPLLYCSLLPLGQLVIDRINRLIEDEFSRIGALVSILQIWNLSESLIFQRISVPILGPKKLWDETERWDAMGKELFQLSDRGKNPFCLQVCQG